MPEMGGISRTFGLPDFRRIVGADIASLKDLTGEEFIRGDELTVHHRIVQVLNNFHTRLDNIDDYLPDQREALAAMYDELAQRANELNEIHALPFYQDNVAAAQTDVALLGPPSTRGYVAPEDGSIITLAVRTNDPRTAGTLTVEPRVNGTKIGFAVALNATDTTFKYDRQDQGLDTFVAGDLIDMVITTDAGWLPVTADIDVSIGVVFFKGVR